MNRITIGIKEHWLHTSRITAGSDHTDLDNLCKDIETLLQIEPRDYYIVGGCIVNWLLDEPIQDVDVILKDTVDIEYIAQNSEEYGNHYQLKNKVTVYYDEEFGRAVPVQILRNRSFKELTGEFDASYRDNLQDVLEQFDLRHTAIAYNIVQGLQGLPCDSASSDCIDAIKYIKYKSLYILNPADNLKTLYRCFKFTQRGWTILPSMQARLVAGLTPEDIQTAKAEDPAEHY